jgi:hypothetical protein
MCFNRLQNRESGVSMEGHLSDYEGQRVFIGTNERMRHFAKWSECGTVSSDQYLLIFLSDVLTNSIACNSGSWLDFESSAKDWDPLFLLSENIFDWRNMRNWWNYQYAARQEESNFILLRVKIQSIFVVWFVFHLWQPFSRNKFKKNMTSEIERHHLL